MSFTKYFKIYSMLKAHLGLLVILGHGYLSLLFWFSLEKFEAKQWSQLYCLIFTSLSTTEVWDATFF